MIYVPFIYFTFLFLYKYKESKQLNAGGVITLIYVINSLFAIFLYYSSPDKSVIDGYLTLAPTIIYCGLLTLSIIPFYAFKSEAIKKLEPPRKDKFLAVCYVLVFLSILRIALSFTRFQDTILLDDFDSVYNDVSDVKAGYGSFGRQAWYDYFLNLGTAWSHISLLMFFFACVFLKGEKNYLKILLFISSLTIVVTSIITASRTQVIYWIIMFSLLYVVFKPVLGNVTKRYITSASLGIMILLLVYFSAVTFSRFSNNDFGVEGGLVSYIGQPYIKFCNLYHVYTFDTFTFDRVFPLTCHYLGGNDILNIVDFRAQVSSRIHFSIGVFYTFLGDAMVDFGKIGMFVYTIILYWLSSISLKRKNYSSWTISNAMLFLLFSRQVALGSFAYVYKSISTSQLIIAILFLAYFFRKSSYGK